MSKLNNFSWDDNPELQGKFGEDFEQGLEEIGDKEGKEGHEPFVKKEETPEDGEGKNSNKQEKPDDDGDGTEEDKNHEFQFGGEEDDSDEDESEKEKEKTPSKNEKQKAPVEGGVTPKGVVSFLKNKGFLDLNEEVDLESMSDAEVEDQIEDFIDASNEAFMESQIAELPDIAKNILKIAAKGGDVNKYLSSIATQSTGALKKGMDLSSEQNQENVLRSILASEGKEADEIEDEIEFLKSKNRLEAQAEKKYNKWLESKEEEESNLLKEETKRKSAAKENTRKYRGELGEFLGKNKEINSFNITATDKRDLPNYIANPAYETPNGNSISEFQKDLFEAMKDNNKVVVLAKILKSGFDFSKLIEKGASTAIKNTKDKIQSVKPNNIGKQRAPRRLIDMLDD